MTAFLPASGSISMSQVKSVFFPSVSGAISLSQLAGVRWFKANASSGVFTDYNLTFSSLYGKGPASGIPAGSKTFVSAGTFVVPTYSIMTVVIRAGAGGGAGGGSPAAQVGSPGTPGGSSSFGAFGTALGGGAGFFGANGAAGLGSDGLPAGGVGGFPGGGTGGAGGKVVLTLTNPINSGGTGPAVGSQVAITIGAGGAGGALGIVSSGNPPIFGTPGFPGGGGSIDIGWS
jgi:hypothetical protein